MIVIVPTACRARLCRNLVCVVARDRGARPGCIALAARWTLRGPAAGGIAQRRGAARRHRLPASAGLENLLADARRFRRAAALRLLQIGKYRSRDSSVAGADEIRRRRRRPLDGLSRPDRAAVADRREKCRQAGDASRRHQLRGLRKALHSRRSQSRTRLHQRGEHRGQRAVRSARHRAEAGQCRRSQPADHPRRQARRQIDGAGRCGARPTPATVNLFVEGPTPDWALPVPKLLEQARPGSSASPSNSTACRRAPIPKAPRSN